MGRRKLRNSYRKRYCVFIDILGFSELVADLGRGDKAVNVKVIKSLLQKTYKLHAFGAEREIDADLRLQSISDAIVISSFANQDGFHLIMTAVSTLVTELLSDGFFLRGALTKGRFYHDNNMAFGEALVRAYKLESTQAKYPRILVDDNVIKDAERYRLANKPEKHPFGVFSERFALGTDGHVFLNVLRLVKFDIKIDQIHERNDEIERHEYKIAGKKYDFESREPFRKEWKKIRPHLVRRLARASSNPRHFEKVRWFVKYWNSVLPEEYETYDGFEPIVGVGLDERVIESHASPMFAIRTPSPDDPDYLNLDYDRA